MLRRADELGLTSRKSSNFRKKKKFELTNDQKKEFRDAFELFDSEKTGFIDCHELKVAMRALGFPMKKQHIIEALTKVGREDIGKVDIADFLRICKTLR